MKTNPKPLAMLLVFAELLLCMGVSYQVAHFIERPLYLGLLPYLYFSPADVAHRQIAVHEITIASLCR